MKQCEKGMSLIEVLVSFALLTLVIVSTFYVLTAARYLSEEARGRFLALNAARSTLEAVKDTNLLNLGTINTANYVPADLRNGNITITTNPAILTGVQIATVTVTVQWTGPKNTPKRLEMTTMRSRF